jgi:hypothetical protein
VEESKYQRCFFNLRHHISVSYQRMSYLCSISLPWHLPASHPVSSSPSSRPLFAAQQQQQHNSLILRSTPGSVVSNTFCFPLALPDFQLATLHSELPRLRLLSTLSGMDVPRHRNLPYYPAYITQPLITVTHTNSI